MAYRCALRVLPGLIALAVALASLAGRAIAEPSQQPTPGPDLEMWSGGQAFGADWSAYAGATRAPFGNVRADGLRLRAVAGIGAHQRGQIAFADLLAGYHWQLGPLTLKAFAGLAAAEHAPTDPTSFLEGTALGPKAVLETWWTIGDQAWASLDLAFSMPHMQVSDRIVSLVDRDRIDYAGRLRLGWRLWPELSVGFEGGAGGPLAPTLQSTWASGIAHAGGFLRFEWAQGEVSVSGGLAAGGDDREGHSRPYGTVSVLTRF